MDLIPNDWKHLLRIETPQKFLLKTFYYNNKDTSKVKDSQKSLVQKFASPFYLIVLKTTNLSNSSHGQTSMKDTIFSALKFGVKLSLIGLEKVDIYFLALQYKEWATHQIF